MMVISGVVGPSICGRNGSKIAERVSLFCFFSLFVDVLLPAVSGASRERCGPGGFHSEEARESALIGTRAAPTDERPRRPTNASLSVSAVLACAMIVDPVIVSGRRCLTTTFLCCAAVA